jgi:hypothetical protein
VGAQAGAEESAGQAAFSVSATACVAARACGARAPQHMHSARLATHTTGRARRRPLTCRCHGFWCTRALAPVPASTHHVHALHHVAKHHVLAVQPLGLHGAQEDCGWVVDGGARRRRARQTQQRRMHASTRMHTRARLRVSQPNNTPPTHTHTESRWCWSRRSPWTAHLRLAERQHSSRGLGHQPRACPAANTHT